MKTETNVKNQSTATVQEHYTTGSVASKDGTTIGYRQYGHGPGIVLVQGAMGSAHNFMRLAGVLADAFTVYVPDRRGRGLSDLPYSKDYHIQKDVEDLDALLAKTGARSVFGLSSGALISLQAALTLPAIHKIAIFEPPLYINGVPAAASQRLEKEVAQGKLAAALITGMKTGQMGPTAFRAMPYWLLKPLVNKIMTLEDKEGSGEYLPMKALASALQYDFKIAVEMSGQLQSFRAINIEVLLLGGSKSPAYLKVALGALEKVLPHVTRAEFPGLGHSGAWNYDKQRNPGGRPELVAQELSRFFAEP